MENKDKKNITAIRLQNYVVPKQKEVRRAGLEYISFGENNDYPQYLLDLYNNSAEHNALINGKVLYIAGNGLNLENLDQTVSSFFLKNDMDHILQKIALDYEIFDGFALKVTRNMLLDKVNKISWLDFAKCRLNVSESAVYYADEWNKYKTDAKEYKLWNENSDEAESIYYFTGHQTRGVYPVPKYVGSIQAIETDIEIQNFHLNNVKSGFFPGAIINFNNGIPSEEMQMVIENEIKDKFAGSSNANRFILSFNDSNENSVSITPLDISDLDKKFEIIWKMIQQKIFIGHNIVSPMLFGVRVEGQLGGRQEMIDAYELFKATYVHPRQLILIASLSDLLKQTFGNLNLEIIEATPISETIKSDEKIKYMSESEIREELGLEVIEQTENERIRKLLNSLSPTIAQAVLGTMLPQEIKQLLEE